MIKKKVEFKEKNHPDAYIEENAFTQAVKKASGEDDNSIKNTKTIPKEGKAPKIDLKLKDELMRAREAKFDPSVESEKFRKDED